MERCLENRETGVMRAFLPPSRTRATVEGPLFSLASPHPIWLCLGWKSFIETFLHNCLYDSCWAFASTETLEAHWAINTGILVELSEQFILDCTPNPHKVCMYA